MVNLQSNRTVQAYLAAWHGPFKRHVRIATLSSLLTVAIVLGTGVSYARDLFPGPVEAEAPLTPEQVELMDLTRRAEADPTSANQARLINAKLPVSTDPVQAAQPFAIAGAHDRQLALECLTEAVYYEAGFQPLQGRRAVAQVVLNRLRHPAFPKTVCGVVYEGVSRDSCQFSFVCDGALHRTPDADAWRQAHAVAEAALNGFVMTSVGEATHYHADYVAPSWASRLTKIRRIGAHIFYRWPGGWGEPAAFDGRYAGAEHRIFGKLASPTVVAAVETSRGAVPASGPALISANASTTSEGQVAAGS